MKRLLFLLICLGLCQLVAYSQADALETSYVKWSESALRGPAADRANHTSLSVLARDRGDGSVTVDLRTRGKNPDIDVTIQSAFVDDKGTVVLLGSVAHLKQATSETSAKTQPTVADLSANLPLAPKSNALNILWNANIEGQPRQLTVQIPITATPEAYTVGVVLNGKSGSQVPSATVENPTHLPR